MDAAKIIPLPTTVRERWLDHTTILSVDSTNLGFSPQHAFPEVVANPVHGPPLRVAGACDTVEWNKGDEVAILHNGTYAILYQNLTHPSEWPAFIPRDAQCTIFDVPQPRGMIWCGADNRITLEHIEGKIRADWHVGNSKHNIQHCMALLGFIMPGIWG